MEKKLFTISEVGKLARRDHHTIWYHVKKNKYGITMGHTILLSTDEKNKILAAIKNK